jgi:hypothetical protein
MAGPHVAGVVGLMRAANPDLDVQTIKQILMDTCTDLGPSGEDNTYGHGFINAYEAVLASLAGGTDTVSSSGLPNKFELAAPQPNPFSKTTSIRFAVPIEGRHVAISVFDVTGRRVRRLVDGLKAAGYHTVGWNGRDAEGDRAASGVYFYRMEAGSFEQVQKATLLK